MKINEHTPANPEVDVQRVDGKKTDRQQAVKDKTLQPAEGDKVDLSPISRDVERLKELVKAQPDVRTDKVNRIKEALKDGSRDVTSEQVADKMIGDA